MSAMVQPIPKTTLYKQCQPVYCVLLYMCTVSTLNDKHEVQGTGVWGGLRMYAQWAIIHTRQYSDNYVNWDKQCNEQLHTCPIVKSIKCMYVLIVSNVVGCVLQGLML